MTEEFKVNKIGWFSQYVIHLDTDDPKKFKKFARKFRWSLFWNKFTFIPDGIARIERL